MFVDPNLFTPTGVVYMSMHLSRIHVKSSCSERVCVCVCVCVWGREPEDSAVTAFWSRHQLLLVMYMKWGRERGERREGGRERGRVGERERDSTSHQISSITKT